jgi:hypothetical protein
MKHIRKQINIIENKSFSDSDSEEKQSVVPFSNNDNSNEIFKLETISYLNDNQVNTFLSIDESVNYYEAKLDNNNNESIVNYIKKLLDINSFDNMGILFKIYFVNKIFRCLLNSKNFLTSNIIFMNTVKNKIKELELEYSLITFAETNLTKSFIKTLKNMKELIASIEKN